MTRYTLPNLVIYLRNRLVRRGLLTHGHTLSDRVLGATRRDTAHASPSYGTHPESDAWPIHRILEVLEAGEALGYAHYNDGECRCLRDGWHRTRDDVHVCTDEARSLLAGSLTHLEEHTDPRVRERFLVGLPCPRCHGTKGEDLLAHHPGIEAYTRVPATLFHHAVSWSRDRVVAALAAREGALFLACSTEHDVAALEAMLGRPFAGVLRVDRFDAHLEAHRFPGWLDEIGWGRRTADAPPPTMLLLCGIMGRPWAVDAFSADPESVTLCLGSYFDDVALGRTLSYVDGEGVRCRRCMRPGPTD